MKHQVGFKKFNLYLFTLIISTLFIPNILYAGTFYVAKNGADSNSGTITFPFKSIKKGITTLSAGDTLYVKSGSYYESILSWQTPIPHGTSWDAPITIAAFPGDTVTITAPSGHAAFWLKDPTIQYLIIDGFIMDGREKALHGVKLSGGAHIRVQNSEIKNSAHSGILVTSCSGCDSTAALRTYHEFLNLHVHHNGSSVKDHGFYIQTSNNLVEHCDIHHNASNGGKFYNGYFASGASASTAANNNTIRYSTIHNNSQNSVYPDDPDRSARTVGWILSSGEGNEAYGNVSYDNHMGFMIGHGAKNALLYNNLIYSNADHGVLVHGRWGGSTGAKVFNNTVYNNGISGVLVKNDAKDTLIKNNIAFKNGSDPSKNMWLVPDQAPGTVTSNNFLADPKFIEASALNFKLQAGSQAIDAGQTIPEVTLDFFGVKRAQGQGYDIGAIEQEQGIDTIPPSIPMDITIN